MSNPSRVASPGHSLACPARADAGVCAPWCAAQASEGAGRAPSTPRVPRFSPDVRAAVLVTDAPEWVY